MEPEYDDSWATCARTYATLRIFSLEITPAEMSEALGVAASDCYTVGQEFGRTGQRRKTNAWFLRSERNVDSLDLSRHIDWLLDQIGASEVLLRLTARGAKADIFCYWESKSGHGGPEFSPPQMGRLSALGLPLGIDVYFPDEPADPSSEET